MLRTSPVTPMPVEIFRPMPMAPKMMARIATIAPTKGIQQSSTDTTPSTSAAMASPSTVFDGGGW